MANEVRGKAQSGALKLSEPTVQKAGVLSDAQCCWELRKRKTREESIMKGTDDLAESCFCVSVGKNVYRIASERET